jgi:hypothetical protein
MKTILKRIQCFFLGHQYRYLWGNYHSSKDTFECENCGKRKEE